MLIRTDNPVTDGNHSARHSPLEMPETLIRATNKGLTRVNLPPGPACWQMPTKSKDRPRLPLMACAGAGPAAPNSRQHDKAPASGRNLACLVRQSREGQGRAPHAMSMQTRRLGARLVAAIADRPKGGERAPDEDRSAPAARWIWNRLTCGNFAFSCCLALAGYPQHV